MIRVAALVLGVALLASACGGKPATSAAEIAPADAISFLSVPPKPEQPLTRRALVLTETWLQTLIDRAAWARAAGGRVELAELRDHRLVAYARLKDTKRLDAAGLVHARARGWTVFAPTEAALAAARSKRHLADLPWFAEAAKAARGSGWTVVTPGWVTVSADGGTVRRTSLIHGSDAPHALAKDIPADAVAVAAVHDARRLLRALPWAAQVQRLLGVRLADVARATPGSAVLYVRAGSPIPSVTLLSENGTLAAARRVARELAPGAQRPVQENVNGLMLSHVALGAVDLYYGRVGSTLVLTNDPQISLRGKRLEPSGLPDSTSEWFYVDVARVRPALASLGRLAGKSSWATDFDRRFKGFSSFLTYTTHDGGEEIGTVVVR